MEMIDTKYVGHWKYLEKAIFEYPEANANRAVLELAVLFRSLDDDQNISAEMENWEFGTICGTDGTASPLKLRDVPNKIIHARELEWDLKDHADPRLICHAHPNQGRFKWTRAHIAIQRFASACGTLMS